MISKVKQIRAYVKAYPERQAYYKKYDRLGVRLQTLLSFFFLIMFAVVTYYMATWYGESIVNGTIPFDNLIVFTVIVLSIIIMPLLAVYVLVGSKKALLSLFSVVSFEQEMVDRYMTLIDACARSAVRPSLSLREAYDFVYIDDVSGRRDHIKGFVQKHLAFICEDESERRYVSVDGVTDAILAQLSLLLDGVGVEMPTENILDEPFAFMAVIRETWDWLRGTAEPLTVHSPLSPELIQAYKTGLTK